MGLLHVSINAEFPQNVAEFLAHLLGGNAMPFPPFPDSWIAFAATDDGTAIEVYPLTHVLQAGPEQIECRIGTPDSGPSFAHAAIASSLLAREIILAATERNWLARTCNRGPFHCVEVWLENRLLIEVLDPGMQQEYRNGMTMTNWARMFDLNT
ncbi:hypothetical protein [Roseibium sp. SCP14]|uniref:hypothetical protein n=1 Tax=Roseibium sp. SCP14 TaxID=3141375 RepID=UPI0033395628